MKTIDLHTIGNNLLSLRISEGYTQYEVAELAGISDRTYADIERGKVNMRIGTLLSICKALKIEPETVLSINDINLMWNKKNLYKSGKTEYPFLSEDISSYEITQLHEKEAQYIGTVSGQNPLPDSNDNMQKTVHPFSHEEIVAALSRCNPRERNTAMQLLAVYLNSLQHSSFEADGDPTA